MLIPALQEGWPRLLQSYKLYGDLVLWGLLLWAGQRGIVVALAKGIGDL